VLGILYDVHGNLDALDAVLADAREAGVDEWLLGGDYCAFGPWPVETLARLHELEPATWLRGNGERWLADPPLDLPPDESRFLFAAIATANGELGSDVVDELIGLSAIAERPDAFYCHGSPSSATGRPRPTTSRAPSPRCSRWTTSLRRSHSWRVPGSRLSRSSRPSVRGAPG
jgi:hypothetical protein